MIELGKAKILLKTGLWIDGVINSWTTSSAEITAESGSKLVILKPEDNVILIKYDNKTKIKTEMSKAIEMPSDNPQRIQKIAELKIQMNEVEKESFLDKAKSHTVGNARNISYGQPRFFKK